jgi:signal transduction histidine kinase
MRGIGLRITIIMSASIALLLVATLGLFIAQHRGEAPSFRLPLPGQVGAIADMVEAMPADRLPTLLAAVNSDNLFVTVQDTPPSSGGSEPAPGITWLLRRYISASSGRQIQAMFQRLDERQSIGLQRDAQNDEEVATTMPLRLVVTLKDGRYLVLETRRADLSRFTGIRLGLGLLIVTIVISATTLILLRRQVKPIEELAGLVETVGADPATTATMLDLGRLPKKAGRETKQLAAAIVRMQQRIGTLLAGRTRMLASIGHDLGTYLTRLRLRSEFIADEAQRAAAIRDIEDMDALISDTLVLAEVEQNREPVQATDLVALVRRQASGFASVNDGDGNAAPVHLHCKLGKLELPLRPVAIARAVNNLISNALRYGNEANITLTRDSDRAVLLVEDRGPGIPEAEREIVLEAFHRRDSARNLDQRGFGLGLAIVNDILRQHGGTIAFSDRPGGGLTVTVTLPITTDSPTIS